MTMADADIARMPPGPDRRHPRDVGVEPLEDPAAPHKEPVEPSSETPVLRLLVLASEPLQAQEGGDRSRDQEGGEERERDGEGQRDEEQPRLALQEDRGQEN